MQTRLTLVALAAAYAFLTRASGLWLIEALTAPQARGNLIVVVLLSIAAIRAVRRPSDKDTIPHRPLLVVAAAAIAYVSVRWFFPWHRLHAVIALAGAYGLVGCWVTPSTWRRGLAALALVIAALPFGEQLEVLVGYPLRLVITDAAQNILGHLGAHGTSRATLLVFESGAAQIDVPCSGVKSLWAGALLTLASPLVLKKSFGLRWVAASIGFALALCIGNTLRIVALVLLAVPAHQPQIAAIIHRPLGCAAFIATAIAYVQLIRRSSDTPFRVGHLVHAPRRLALGVAACIAAIAPLAPASARAHKLDEKQFITLPDTLITETIALTEQERSFFEKQGAERASKVRFTWNGAHGSLILVRSAQAAAQHPPEQCLTAAGHVIADARTVMLDTSLSVRLLALEHGSAVSWFQSGSATHGDYAARVWAAGTWTQVSILFDDRDADHVPSDLVHALYRAITQAYQGDTNA